jgi:hypothetical protein
MGIIIQTIFIFFKVCRSENRNAYGVLVRKCEERRPCGRPRVKWEDNTNL